MLERPKFCYPFYENRWSGLVDNLHISRCLPMAAAILLTLSLDQNQKVLVYVGFGSVFALEKSKIITLYKGVHIYIILHLSGCSFNFCNSECIMSFPHSLF